MVESLGGTEGVGTWPGFIKAVRGPLSSKKEERKIEIRTRSAMDLYRETGEFKRLRLGMFG